MPQQINRNNTPSPTHNGGSDNQSAPGSNNRGANRSNNPTDVSSSTGMRATSPNSQSNHQAQPNHQDQTEHASQNPIMRESAFVIIRGSNRMDPSTIMNQIMNAHNNLLQPGTLGASLSNATPGAPLAPQAEERTTDNAENSTQQRQSTERRTRHRRQSNQGFASLFSGANVRRAFEGYSNAHERSSEANSGHSTTGSNVEARSTNDDAAFIEGQSGPRVTVRFSTIVIGRPADANNPSVNESSNQQPANDTEGDADNIFQAETTIQPLFANDSDSDESESPQASYSGVMIPGFLEAIMDAVTQSDSAGRPSTILDLFESLRSLARPLVVTKGNEFDEITQWSSANPGATTRVQYQGENSYDDGGVFRDVLTAAFEQLVELKLVHLDTESGTYLLPTLDYANSSNSESALERFKGLGHLIGLTLKHNKEQQEIDVDDEVPTQFLTDLPLGDTLFQQITALLPLVQKMNSDEVFHSHQASGRQDPIIEFSTHALGFPMNDVKAKQLIEDLTGTPEALTYFNQFLKDSGYTDVEFSDSTINAESGFSRPQKRPRIEEGANWVDQLWSSNESEDSDSATHKEKIRSTLKKAAQELGERDLTPITSAKEFLDILINEIAPKLAVAEGLSEIINTSIPTLDPINNPEEFKSKVVDTVTLKEKLAAHLADGGTEQEFFEANFNIVDLANNGERNDAIREHLPKKMVSLIRNSSQEELRDILKYATGCPILPKDNKIDLHVNGSYINSLPISKIKDIPLPEAHSCGKYLVININYIIPREGISDESFKQSFIKAITLQKRHGDGIR